MFKKYAEISLIPLSNGSFVDDSIVFQKQAALKIASAYGSRPQKIDVGSILKLVSSEYSISSDPRDYIFEAARAVTAEEPNQNADAFPKSELLRFDHYLAKPVYQTFIPKPHHIQHRSDNPKNARGVVLDATYNDLAQMLEQCPGCGNDTTKPEAIDKTGICCIKCGHLVKDEFVELLIAIDTKKDPKFAEGVRNGSLNSLSMGCSASYVECSICGNKAKNTSEFCNHIKSGNKKKIFKTASGPRMSYEICGGVIFDEISRVDKPADPKATQREVFNVDAKSVPDLFTLVNRAATLNGKLSKGAQLVGNDADDIDSVLEKIEELKVTHPNLYVELKKILDPGSEDVPKPMSIGDYEEKHKNEFDKDISLSEMGIKPKEEASKLPTVISAASKVNADINNEFSRLLNNSKENTVSSPTLKFAKSYEDLEVNVTNGGNINVFTPKGTLFVVRPDVKPVDDKSAKKIATAVLMNIAENGIVNTMKNYNVVMSTKFAQILQHHVEDFAGGRSEGDTKAMQDGGEGDTASDRGATQKSMQDSAMTDHKEKLHDPGKRVIDSHEVDHQEGDKKPSNSILDDGNTCTDVERDSPKKTLDDVTLDFSDKKAAKGDLPDFMKKDEKKEEKKDEKKDEKKAQVLPPIQTPTAQPDQPQMVIEQQVPGQVQQTAAGGKCEKCDMERFECTCLIPAQEKEAVRKYVSRLERLYKSRIDKIKSESESKVAAAESSAVNKLHDKFLRSIKLAAKRQSLNLEESPFKAKMFDILATEMDLDRDTFYPGMDPFTATKIVETVSSSAIDDLVNSVIKRASEFMSMNDETIKQIESDIKNLRPASVSVQASEHESDKRDDVRTAAVNGNLIVAPSASSNELVSNTGKRDNIRSALDTTKVRRTSQALLK